MKLLDLFEVAAYGLPKKEKLELAYYRYQDLLSQKVPEDQALGKSSNEFRIDKEDLEDYIVSQVKEGHKISWKLTNGQILETIVASKEPNAIVLRIDEARPLLLPMIGLAARGVPYAVRALASIKKAAGVRPLPVPAGAAAATATAEEESGEMQAAIKKTVDALAGTAPADIIDLVSDIMKIHKLPLAAGIVAIKGGKGLWDWLNKKRPGYSTETNINVTGDIYAKDLQNKLGFPKITEHVVDLVNALPIMLENKQILIRFDDKNYDLDQVYEKQIYEVLSCKQPVGDWISDFQKSKNKKFKDKTKKQRQNQALGAYYAKCVRKE